MRAGGFCEELGRSAPSVLKPFRCAEPWVIPSSPSGAEPCVQVPVSSETEPEAEGSGRGSGAPLADSGAPPPIIPPFKEGSFLWRAGGIVRAMRPEQWFKNVFVLAPIVFAKHLTHPTIVISAIGGFGTFCLLASSVYVMNDLVDLEADRVHPKKRYRPIASGRVSIAAAKVLGVALVLIGLGGAAIGPWPFLVTVASYLVLQVAYSFKLKKIAYVDVGCIALGFVLRVLAGSFAVRVSPSGYMLACTALIALFMGFGKRRHELASVNAAKQRAALDQYSARSLTIALAITGLAAVATYLAYTLDPATRALFGSHYLWMTTIHPAFGVVRFLQLVITRPKAESPTQEILRDTPFMMNLVLYAIEVVVIVYQLRPSG
ncbi:MAG: UbiA family prenyltransferase [Myxococcales bacterium]|nr:UbiA family prenyltransferase [Myxococcales bacterium]